MPKSAPTRFTPDKLWSCLCLTQARTADVPLIAAASGFDCIYVDLEHTAVGLETASMLCIVAAGAGMIPLVRVSANDPQLIARLLDTGAHGVIVPHVGSAAEAAAVVAACRFAPRGERPQIGPNPVNRYRAGSMAEVVAACDAATVVAVMIETAGALRDVRAIAAVPGLDLLIIGAWDLSASLGIAQQFSDARFREGVKHAAEACAAEGKVLGLAGISDPQLIAEFVALGVRFVSAGTDALLLREAASARIAMLQSITVPSQGEAES